MFREWEISDNSENVNGDQVFTESEYQDSEGNIPHLARDISGIVPSVYIGLLKKMEENQCSI